MKIHDWTNKLAETHTAFLTKGALSLERLCITIPVDRKEGEKLVHTLLQSLEIEETGKETKIYHATHRGREEPATAGKNTILQMSAWKSSGLDTLSQALVMCLCAEKGSAGILPSECAKKVNTSCAAITFVIKGLEEKGLLFRGNMLDRRKRPAMLTGKGARLIISIYGKPEKDSE